MCIKTYVKNLNSGLGNKSYAQCLKVLQCCKLWYIRSTYFIVVHATVSNANYCRRQKDRSSHLPRDQFNRLSLITPKYWTWSVKLNLKLKFLVVKQFHDLINSLTHKTFSLPKVSKFTSSQEQWKHFFHITRFWNIQNTKIWKSERVKYKKYSLETCVRESLS